MGKEDCCKKGEGRGKETKDGGGDSVSGRKEGRRIAWREGEIVSNML